jgi:UDP-N-acetylmuramoyl-L-alanyl-D-glutamate--2,6-diaminopimelate ligase
MTLQELTGAIPGGRVLPSGAPVTAIAEVVHRADLAGPGSLFCCLTGGARDGHEFAPQAVARGAAAIMVERPLDLPVPQALVPDTRLGMALAAAALAGRPSERLTVVGVTGTNGKTTSAFLLRAILEAAGLRCGLVGTVETVVGGVPVPALHTTPDPPELQDLFRRMLDAGDAACAMEVSSHALAQRRVAGVRFAAALFTNLTRDHLDYHADVEEYFAAKRSLFARPPHHGADPPAAANLDDPFGRRLAGEVGALGYALERPADVAPEWVRPLPRGVALRLRTPRGPLELESRLRGRFNVANLAGVVAVGELLGLDHAAVAAGVAGVAGVPGRFEPVESDRPFQVLVDYAHTPDSLENILRAARELAGEGRLWVVFGCGGDRDRGKRPLMGAIARALADVAVVTSDNPRTEDPEAIIGEIVAGAGVGEAVLTVEPDRRRAIELAVGGARAGDVVVIAGKGHEVGQERDGMVAPFDDREVARAALAGAPA